MVFDLLSELAGYYGFIICKMAAPHTAVNPMGNLLAGLSMALAKRIDRVRITFQ